MRNLNNLINRKKNVFCKLPSVITLTMLGRIEKVVKKKGFRNKKERDIEGKDEGFH